MAAGARRPQPMNAFRRYDSGDGLLHKAVAVFQHAGETAGNNGMHSHAGTEFIYCLSGDGFLLAGDRRLPYKSPTLIRLCALLPHAVTTVGAYEQQGICVIPAELQSLCKERGLEQYPVWQTLDHLTDFSCMQIPAEHGWRLENIFRAIDYEMNHDVQYNADAVVCRLMELGVLIRRMENIADAAGRGIAPTVKAVVKPHICSDIFGFIETNLREDLSVSSLARHFNYSEQHVYRLVREITGQSLGEYVRNKRIEHAKMLLISTEMSVTQIAGEVGIDDAAYFCRIFRTITGETPTSYRYT